MDPPEEDADFPLLPQKFAEEKDHSSLQTPQHRTQGQGRYIDDAFAERLVKSATRKRKQFSLIVTTSFFSSLATMFIITGFWTLLPQKVISTNTTNTPFKYEEFYSIASPSATGCGSTVEEALALDCTFDELSDLWLPRKCSRKYEADYLATNDGAPPVYWTAPDGQYSITNRSHYAGGAVYYSTTRDHLHHCEYNLYRFADSLMTGELIGHSEGHGPHMHHCAAILGRFANMAPNIDNIDVDTVSTFGFC